MIPQGVQVFVALDPIDLRCSFDRLSGIAKEHIGYEARSGALFVFYGRRRDAIKVLFYDGSGMCLFYKRLDRGTFQLPEATAEGARHVEVDDATLEALLDGVQVESSEVLFTLMAERYERRSLIITSNLVFGQWDRIFKNPMTTAAAIDRLVHHSVILEFDGKSKRADEAEQRSKSSPQPSP